MKTIIRKEVACVMYKYWVPGMLLIIADELFVTDVWASINGTPLSIF